MCRMTLVVASMKRIFHHFDKWEDFHHGMYDEDKEARKERVKLAASILGDPSTCEKAMRMVIEKWPIATEFNLSNAGINRRAWLGQACCSIYGAVHEDETREAWGYLTNKQRTDANAVADVVDRKWRNRYEQGEKDIQLSLFDLEDAS